MSKQDDIDRVWDIIEKVGVCMLTTQFAGGLRARPLEARPDRDADLFDDIPDAADVVLLAHVKPARLGRSAVSHRQASLALQPRLARRPPFA